MAVLVVAEDNSVVVAAATEVADKVGQTPALVEVVDLTDTATLDMRVGCTEVVQIQVLSAVV